MTVIATKMADIVGIILMGLLLCVGLPLLAFIMLTAVLGDKWSEDLRNRVINALEDYEEDSEDNNNHCGNDANSGATNVM